MSTMSFLLYQLQRDDRNSPILYLEEDADAPRAKKKLIRNVVETSNFRACGRDASVAWLKTLNTSLLDGIGTSQDSGELSTLQYQ